MKKTSIKKLQLKKAVVAELGKKDMSRVGGGQDLFSRLGEVCYSGVVDCESRGFQCFTQACLTGTYTAKICQ